MSVIENGGMLNIIALNFVLVSFNAKFLFHLPNQGIYRAYRHIQEENNTAHYASVESLFIKIREHANKQIYHKEPSITT